MKWRDAAAALSLMAVAAMAFAFVPAVHAGTGGETSQMPDGAGGSGLPSASAPSARRDGLSRGLEPRSLQSPTKRRVDCRRWRMVATNLGETLAGLRLRQTMTGDICRQGGEDGVSIWDWPWAGGALSAVLPPRIAAESGAWQVRCETIAGRRQRCALVHTFGEPSNPRAGTDGGQGLASDDASPARAVAIGISTHFVINAVAGRETVLWRLFMPAMPKAQAGPNVGPPSTNGGPAVAGSSGIATANGDAAGLGRRGGEGPRVRIADDKTTVSGYCAAIGCVLEASPQQSADLVNKLLAESAVALSVEGGRDDVASVLSIPSPGFKSAFKELVRLRRDEDLRGR